MIIACNCGAKLKISDDKLTEAGVRIRCPKCGTTHLAARPQSSALDSPEAETVRSVIPPQPEPSMPWFAPAAAALGPPSRGALVLVAHDSKIVAGMIDGVLRHAGMATAHAANGLEALQMAADLKPQAMVVDVGLTGIYGFELCERLKGDPDTKGIKIILLSSVYGLTAYKRSPENLYGADDYIEKHHIPDQLVPKLQRLFSGGEGAAPGVLSDAGQVAAPHGGTTAADAAVPIEGKAENVPEQPVLPSQRLREERSSTSPEPKGIEIPEIPSILPKTPVTLTSPRKRTESVTSSTRATGPSSAAAGPKQEGPISGSAPVEMTRRGSVATPAPASVDLVEPRIADASVKLDASFFEHEEYEAPAGAASRESTDPAEIEKARRFARIIVSDIVLYNQEAVAEGVREGTFYDLLKDDISEGRTVYAERVPESIRKRCDYLQEAFDDFIASKKKHR